MANRNVLITGANKSIGYETARQLGREGFRGWLGSRDTDQGEAAARRLAAERIDVRLVTLDVTSDDSVRAAVAHCAGRRQARHPDQQRRRIGASDCPAQPTGA